MATASDSISAVSEQVLVEVHDGVKRITLNAPERMNAVDRPMAERFRDAVIESANDDCKVVVITGAGGHFCSGADVNALGRPDGGFENAIDFLEEVSNPIILNMREMAKPVIAAIPGVAAGIGCNIALAVDIRIASTEARFGQVFSRIGLIPDGGGTYLLPRTIGYARAYELMVTGEVFGAEKAHELGLVNEVVAPEELEATVDAWAARLAQGPSLSYAGIKSALNFSETHSLAEALDYEGVEQKKCILSEDFREGTQAFLEKRKPRFQGR